MEIKTCPYCGKKILAIAKVCKHCRRSLREVPAEGGPVPQPPKPKPAPQPVAKPEAPKPIELNETTASQPSEEQYKKPHLLSPKGRIKRSQFLLASIIYWVWIWSPIGEWMGTIGALFGLFFLYQYIIAAIKRNHDFNFCGWWILIPFWTIVALFIPGTDGENDYGPEPK